MEVESRQGVSFRRVGLHALAATAVCVALDVLAVSFVPSGQAIELTRTLVRDLPWIFLFAAAASYGGQARIRWMKVVGAAFTAVGVLAPFVFLGPLAFRNIFAGGRQEPVSLLRVGGGACHESLPLTIGALDATFVENRSIEEKVRADYDPKNVAWWAWSNSKTGEQVILLYVPGKGKDVTAFRDYVTGMRTGVSENQGTVIDAEHLTQNSKPYSYSLLAKLSNGNCLDSFCLSVETKADEHGIACLQTLAATHEMLAKVRESLRIQHCPQAGE